MKIAYVMLVDWRWIKQRPHFIAEELAEKNEVTVFYQHRYGIKGYQKTEAHGVRLKPMFVIPKGDRIPALRLLNGMIKRRIIRRSIKQEGSDCIYLTYPDQVDVIPENFSGQIIYDCMDDHIAFISDEQRKEKLQQLERKLVDRADYVLVSSEKLRDVLCLRCGEHVNSKITTVRNAFNGEIAAVENKQIASKDGSLTIAYFGTISSWFDFDTIQKSIEDFPSIRYLLMGPVDHVTIPDSPNITYLGTVEHKDLQNAVSQADCFIMPFVLNEITRSVDPVKLYEYINFRKNILCIEYPEIERFAPFVHFYSDYSTFKQQIAELLEHNALKYTEQQRLVFLRENDWKSRVMTIEQLCQSKKEA